MRIDNSSQVPQVFGSTNTTSTSTTSQTKTDSSAYSSDKFKGTGDASSEFDKALAKISAMIGGANVLADNKGSSTTSSKTASVKQEEINWALELEKKVKTGYSPTTEETSKYQNIAAKLASTQVKNEVPPTVKEEEVKWALELEEKVKTGYSPTADETSKYQDLANRLKAGNVQQKTDTSTTASVKEEEITWALQLEEKVKTGYSPTPDETSKYQDVANRLKNMSQNNTAKVANKDWATWSQPFTVPRNLFETTPQIIQVPATLRVMSPTKNTLPSYTTVNVGTNLNTLSPNNSKAQTGQVSQQEINWALQLEEKVKAGYQANSSEIYQYENIANRLKVSQGNTTENTNTVNQNTSGANTSNQTTTAPKKSIVDKMKDAWKALVG